ncbi:MAG: GNAT family N-acetyltransferase [Candidatus Thiodiazotropha sp. (ex Monitilora ramsayi)]|nr:GNAT family N-acetyltransferase [Candidatus Thiodiazotropha sp. (ex Monitilora ramsayi)]
MIYRGATSSDLVGIERLLRACRLPSDDIADHVQNFVIVEVADEIIGVGGLQVCGREGLIRSIVIAQDYRERGVAEKLYRILEECARSIRIDALYLLTESAEGYFSRLGFTTIERGDVPRSITETQQYQTLCPSSAKVMIRKL